MAVCARVWVGVFVFVFRRFDSWNLALWIWELNMTMVMAMAMAMAITKGIRHRYGIDVGIATALGSGFTGVGGTGGSFFLVF